MLPLQQELHREYHSRVLIESVGLASSINTSVPAPLRHARLCQLLSYVGFPFRHRVQRPGTSCHHHLLALRELVQRLRQRLPPPGVPRGDAPVVVVGHLQHERDSAARAAVGRPVGHRGRARRQPVPARLAGLPRGRHAQPVPHGAQPRRHGCPAQADAVRRRRQLQGGQGRADGSASEWRVDSAHAALVAFRQPRHDAADQLPEDQQRGGGARRVGLRRHAAATLRRF